ncbi:pentatricopeptide repeat-containing protein At3g49240, mitochondrial isoform X1 [Salvia miltiorrhiza]|uniref:pentatricopeptide repeat-containing protein At3g49240, mitochondrial isoform X1 n=1 Tax=Salvia miltiorrhiza TaxID=226208 RepID=UPI0025AD875A|nr:pentatricopeptide repeat-containing protein At3g49240, mitochondrial isoform X1 [Salvia miltiorrhiza]
MALSKPSFLNQLVRALTGSRRLRPHAPPPAYLPLRHFSFATPEEAAAERRKRKRRLRIEPPLSALRHQQQQQQPRPAPAPQNPNAPKLPEPVSALSGSRLNLHNKILKLIRENDLEEAALFTRHSVYSNCRPTIYTCNAVMSAQLRQGKFSELLTLHRFITQAGIAANVVTYNILLTLYLDCRKIDLALEQYRQLINDAPFNPSPTTYRILIKGLVDNQQVEKANEIKNEMETKGFKPDPTIYSYLMLGQAKNSNADGVFELYEELKQKLGADEILDGVIYGNLMKGYFLKGMEAEAMEVFSKVLGEDSPVKLNAISYNYVLEALSKNERFDEALKLFERMNNEHDPPRKLSVDLGSYNVIVDGYCAEKRFDEAVEVFNGMGKQRCNPDTLSYNVLIDQLCSNDKLAEAEELYKGMGDKNVNPDEYTFVTLMDTCLKENRLDDAAQYFRTMVESKRRPNLTVYNRLVEELVKAGRVDVAKSFFDLMVPKLRMNDDAYKFIMNALSGIGKHDEVVKIVDGMLREDPGDFTEELEEFVRELLRKEGMEDEVTNLKLQLEKEKAEAAAKAAEEVAKAKASTSIAMADLLSSKSFGKKPVVEELSAEGEEEDSVSMASEVEKEIGDDASENEVIGEEPAENEVIGEESAEIEGNTVNEKVA